MNETTKSTFVYLVQGRSDLTEKFLQTIGDRENILIATWDKPLRSSMVKSEQIFFIPNTTWAEGRNFLYLKAQIFFPESEYFIFSDEDALFDHDFLDRFETMLLSYKPGIAIPMCDRIKNEDWFSKKEIEHPIQHDQIFQAFHRDVLAEEIVFPIDTKFDDRSWWLTTHMQQYLIQTKYFYRTLQFNTLTVHNSHHTLETLETTGINPTDSKYLNGKFSGSDLEELKRYINYKFGKQRRVLDTIYQPRYQNKIRIKNLNFRDVEKIFYLFANRRFVKAMKYSIKVIFTFVTNIIYSCFRRNSMLGPYKIPFVNSSDLQ